MLYLLQVLTIILAAATTSIASPGPFLRRSPTATVNEARGLTNAERFQRGLPPLAPRNLYDPTRVRRDTLPSSAASIVARIAVSNKASGSKLGYMNGDTVDTATHATTFSFRNPSSVSDLIELNDYVCFLHLSFFSSVCCRLALVHSQSTGKHYVLAAYVLGYYLGPTSFDSVTLTTSSVSTPANGPQQPDYTKVPTEWVESTVWTIDPSTGIVSAHWVNLDGSRYPVYILAQTTRTGSTTSTTLVFTGSVTLFEARYTTASTTFAEVTLTVETQS
ncbi:hypothetical protein C8R42DRAFT_469123 [Lentinula raphanica]|nr:hypothetical protein C8R42DRAFT_469123 [Lentinula raphanica]